MKRLSLILLLCSFVSIIHSQSYRPYSDGDLAYDDFQAEALDIETSTGMIYFHYEFTTQDREIDGIEFPYTIMEVNVNTGQSWINFDRTQDSDLDYFQVLFDIEHLYAQRYNALVQNNPLEIMYQEASELPEEKTITLDKFKLESQHGTRPDIIQKWKERIRGEINSVEFVKHDIELESVYGLDAHFGIGYNILGNDLKEYYGNGVGLAMGLNFNIKNNFIVLTGNLGIGSIEKVHTEFPLWEKDIHRNDVIWNIGVGRKLQLGNFYFSPFIGPSLINVYVNKNDYEGVFPETGDTKWNIGGGFFFDIPLSKKYSGANQFNAYSTYGTKDIFSNHGLRVSFHYVPKVDLFERYEGNAMSIALSYYGYFGDMKVKD